MRQYPPSSKLHARPDTSFSFPRRWYGRPDVSFGPNDPPNFMKACSSNTTSLFSQYLFLSGRPHHAPPYWILQIPFSTSCPIFLGRTILGGLRYLPTPTYYKIIPLALLWESLSFFPFFSCHDESLPESIEKAFFPSRQIPFLTFSHISFGSHSLASEFLLRDASCCRYPLPLTLTLVNAEPLQPALVSPSDLHRLRIVLTSSSSRKRAPSNFGVSAEACPPSVPPLCLLHVHEIPNSPFL